MSTPNHVDATALDSPKTERARTQIPGEQVTVLYDPALVRTCGGVAAALLFSWFEDLFAASGGAPVPTSGYRAMYRAVAMRPFQFSTSLHLIGNVFPSTKLYQLARLAGNEFWSLQHRRYVFYALEITCRNGGPAILYRNTPLIESTFHPHAPGAISAPKTSAKALAARHSLLISVTTR